MKGTIDIIEAIIGAIIVLVGITMLYPVGETTEAQLTDVGYDCLRNLDQAEVLKYYVANDMTSSLNSSLRGCLPGIIEFSFKACDSVNCNPDYIPTNREVFVSGYLVSGYESYDARLVNVWLWLK